MLLLLPSFPLFFHCVILILNAHGTLALLPRLAPLGEYTLVKRHTYRVHLADWPVKVRLEVPVRTERLLDVSSATIFGVQLDRFEVCNVVCGRVISMHEGT